MDVVEVVKSQQKCGRRLDREYVEDLKWHCGTGTWENYKYCSKFYLLKSRLLIQKLQPTHLASSCF